MIRILIITAVSGFIISVACLSGASALGFRDVFKNGGPNWGAWDIVVDEENDDFKIVPAKDGKGSITVNGRDFDNDTGDYSAFYQGATETRQFAWSGSDQIDVGMPADVIYTQGPTPKVTVTGPAGALDRFYVEGENFRLRGWSSSNTFNGIPTAANLSGNDRPPRLKIEVTAPGVTHFDISGTETVTIENYAQDSLRVDAVGAAKLTAKGSARIAELDMAGVADVDLSGMTLEEADADISGQSKLKVGPRGRLEADATGMARITLTQNPANTNLDVSGGAVVERANGQGAAPTVAASKTK